MKSSNYNNFETPTMRCKQTANTPLERANREIDKAMRIAKYSKNKATYNESIYDNFRKKEHKPTEEVRISHYRPENPLNGSSSWTKQQWEDYKASQKK